MTPYGLYKEIERLKKKCKCSKIQVVEIEGVVPESQRRNTIQVLTNGEVWFVACDGQTVLLGSEGGGTPMTCEEVLTCIGVSEAGDPTLFLNQQGDFVSVLTDVEFNRVANYSALPPANLHTDEYYHVEASQGTSWLPGGLGGTYYSKGFYYSDGVSWVFVGEVPYQATQGDVDAGVITDQFVSPATLANASQWDTKHEAIQFQDEGVNLGAVGDADTVNFTGAGVTASRVADVVTVNIGGGGSVTFGTDNQIPFTNVGGTDFDYSSNFTFDGTNAYLGNNNTSTTPILEIEQLSTGDAALQFSIPGAAFAVGIDNSDLDRFKISYAAGAGTAVLGTNDLLTIETTGAAVFSNTVRLAGYTVATLPTGVQGDTAFVTDALNPTIGATVSGGGADVVPVFYNGTNWIVDAAISSSSGGYNVVNISTDPYNVAFTSGEYILLVDTAAGDININLNTAVGNTAKIVIKKVDSSVNVVNVNPDGTELIDGDVVQSIAFQYTAFTTISDNSNWWII